MATPTVTSCTPNNGVINQTHAGVVIAGTNFDPAATVDVSGDAATSVVVDSPTKITCTFPAKATQGLVTITVTNPGPDPGSLVNGYYYFNPTWDPRTGILAGPVTDVEIGLDADAGDLIWNMIVKTPSGTFLPCYLRDGSGSQMQLVGVGLSVGWVNLETRPLIFPPAMRSVDGPWKITLGTGQDFMCLYRSVKLDGG